MLRELRYPACVLRRRQAADGELHNTTSRVHTARPPHYMCMPPLAVRHCPPPPPLLRQVNWAVDLTEGKAADPWRASHLSTETKEHMWQLHSKEGCVAGCWSGLC